MSQCSDDGCYCQDNETLDTKPTQSQLRQAMADWEAANPADLNSAEEAK